MPVAIGDGVPVELLAIHTRVNISEARITNQTTLRLRRGRPFGAVITDFMCRITLLSKK